jgi:hypothetical protein
MHRKAGWAIGPILTILACLGVADDFPGMSVESPAGDQWVQVQRTVHTLVWMRKTDRADMTMGVALLTQGVSGEFASHEDFTRWVRKTKESNPDPRRFRLVSSLIEPAGDGLPSCVRYITDIEDTTGGAGEESILRLHVAGLACLHPDDPSRFVDAQYSARMPRGTELPPELEEEGKAFVESLSFRPPPADGDWSLGDSVSAPSRRQAS